MMPAGSCKEFVLIFPRDQQTPEALRTLHKAEIESGGRSSRRRASRPSDRAAHSMIT